MILLSFSDRLVVGLEEYDGYPVENMGRAFFLALFPLPVQDNKVSQNGRNEETFYGA